ncbi:hypothetical protein K6K41_18115 [Chenggangzhangella methanolivorans]|uniref:Uncharacterized protein n=1 Tax=Chenggangzhangella methanolivorans TaxID=1437009 RepID=A0A9E6UJZ1_9HYPH|nr:hypothetical protein [Chenggangzhangella methanolivorans]QZO02553.1 hypothetical protein K6K41_18115 [Chenggangzhangella methanolivorans]
MTPSASGAASIAGMRAASVASILSSHRRENTVMASSAGTVATVNEVLTPKLPPPPPRKPQNRFGSAPCDTERTAPSAVTISAPVIASEPTPKRRMLKPMPPPSMKPAMPTVGQRPWVMARPAARSPAATSRLRQPAPIVTRPLAAS